MLSCTLHSCYDILKTLWSQTCICLSCCQCFYVHIWKLKVDLRIHCNMRSWECTLGDFHVRSVHLSRIQAEKPSHSESVPVTRLASKGKQDKAVHISVYFMSVHLSVCLSIAVSAPVLILLHVDIICIGRNHCQWCQRKGLRWDILITVCINSQTVKLVTVQAWHRFWGLSHGCTFSLWNPWRLFTYQQLSFIYSSTVSPRECISAVEGQRFSAH